MSSQTKNSKANPLLILGWDGAERTHIERLCEEGQLPHLQQFLQYGLQSPISSLQPMLSPLLWTSVVTGKRAHDHGLLGFVEQSLEGPKAISNLQRKVPALWNILSEAAYTCQVLNWWPSNPAEEIRGSFISNLAFSEGAKQGQCWPDRWTNQVAELKPQSIDQSVLAGFFPDYNAPQLEEDPIVQKAAQIIQRTLHQFNTALALMDEEADCRFFYFEALDQLQHLGASAHRKNASPYRYIVDAAYRWHDAMLGSLLQKASNHNVLILSDHGFKLGEKALDTLPDVPGAPALEHNPFGAFMAAGPDIAQNQSLFGLSLLDLCPTLLHYFALPVGEDMAGRVQHLFRKGHQVSFIPSWNTLVETVFSSAERLSHTELLNDLEELGYVDLNGAQAHQFIEEEQGYNQAISLKEVGRYQEGLELCKQYRQDSPKAYRWVILQARLLLLLNDESGWANFWAQLNTKQKSDPHLRFNALLFQIQKGELDEGLRAMRDLEADGFSSPMLKSELGHSLLMAGNLKAADREFSEVLEGHPQFSSALNGKAQLSFAQEDYEQFQIWANRALKLKMHQPHLHFLWASYYWQQGQSAEARKALDLCLKMAPLHQKAKALKDIMEGKEGDDFSIIVSGFPRSGTSFMMRLLSEAGIPIITDHQRKADVHNPQGYYEWEGVKDLARGLELPETNGKALKVVAPLLAYLPANRKYKVIWMDRPTLELVLSQTKMRGEAARLDQFPFEKGQQLESEKKRLQKWLNHQPHMDWLEISYPDLIASDPETLLAQLSRHLNRQINREAWEKAAQPELHRNKIG